jgi:hypothetical protein
VGGPQSFSDKFFGAFGRFDPEEGVTVMEPAAAGPGNWVGCPSVLYDPVRESILLTYRRRRPRGEPDDRGHECGIAESRDGVRFTELWRVRMQELGSASMERFNLHRDRDGHARPHRAHAGRHRHRRRQGSPSCAWGRRTSCTSAPSSPPEGPRRRAWR